MIMFKPELYQNNNSLPKKDTTACLEKYAKKIKWDSDDAIIDIGCGDGGTTGVVLKEYIPDYKKIVGCDKSEVMVKYANEVHGDQRTSFIHLDIEGKLPEELKGTFNHAFSFFVGHWIRNYDITFSNIYNLLREGGDCLQVFFDKMPPYDVFKTMSESKKWSPYLTDIENFMPVHHNSKDATKLFREIMEKTGFQNVEVRSIDTSFIYHTDEELKRIVEAVNPFKMPPDVQEEFLTDYVKIAKEMNVVKVNADGELLLKYSVLEIYGTK